MMQDRNYRQELEAQLEAYLERMDSDDDWPYYSEEKLEEVLRSDIFSAGILLLECIQNFNPNKKKSRLKEEDLADVLEICQENYSGYFNFIVGKMVDFNVQTRWTLQQIQEYLSDIYSFDKEMAKLSSQLEILEEAD